MLLFLVVGVSWELGGVAPIQVRMRVLMQWSDEFISV